MAFPYDNCPECSTGDMEFEQPSSDVLTCDRCGYEEAASEF